ncbi:YceI family protein [Streptomyces sp. NPDC096538]|uniref:YceI family protein n=1 Tax=Streptomyces sp. NPDC096538 TaxID=3155427 RepID=UPI0033236C70
MSSEVQTPQLFPDLIPLSGEYVIDQAHSSIGFSIRHAMVTDVRGSFTDFGGGLVLDGEHPEQSRAWFDVALVSIDTNNKVRDAHLRTADFFDVEQHPVMSFRSTAVCELGGDAYGVTGDLTLNGTTHSVSIDLEFNGWAVDPTGEERIGFEGCTTLFRSRWGLTWNSALKAGGMLLGDKVKVCFGLAALRMPTTPL